MVIALVIKWVYNCWMSCCCQEFGEITNIFSSLWISLVFSFFCGIHPQWKQFLERKPCFTCKYLGCTPYKSTDLLPAICANLVGITWKHFDCSVCLGWRSATFYCSADCTWCRYSNTILEIHQLQSSRWVWIGNKQ